jgi:hypothetical protein
MPGDAERLARSKDRQGAVAVQAFVSDPEVET